MKTTNPVLDSIVETQTQLINNWMDSAKKMQSAFTSGNIAAEGQNLYKEYFEKQMAILNNMQRSSGSFFNGTENNAQDFFRNWFNQQASYAKQMADFTQSVQNSFANFGKPAHDYMSNFASANNAFTGVYNSWLNTLNTTYDNLSRNMSNPFSKNVFADYMQGNKVYATMQEFFQPMAESMKKGQFNIDAFRQYFSADSYRNLSKEMFSGFYTQNSVRDLYDSSLKQLQGFFTTQHNLGREYYAQLQKLGENMPQMFGSNITSSLKEYYNQVQDVFGKTFEPLLKLVNAGKEKEQAEAIIALLDKVAQYSIKQSELQLQLQDTARKAVEKVANQYAEKYSDVKNLTEAPSAQDLYSEWIKVNEQLFTELFASEEFSKVKAENISLSLELKNHFEKQFENAFQNTPLVFKSEVEELHKTIHDLKKQVRELQNKLAMQGVENGEEEKARTRKK